MIGFEPTATRSQSECSTKLSYIPLFVSMYKHEQLGVIERTKKQVVLTEIGRSIKLN